MKYSVYTKWHWTTGMMSQGDMEDFMKNEVKPNTEAADIIWWKIDDSHHGALITYPSEVVAMEERSALEKNREESFERGLELIEESTGPVLVRMSDL